MPSHVNTSPDTVADAPVKRDEGDVFEPGSFAKRDEGDVFEPGSFAKRDEADILEPGTLAK